MFFYGPSIKRETLEANMIGRFNLFILVFVTLLQLFVSNYVSLNDLAVYGSALQVGKVYEGDFSFEFLQLSLSALLGPDRVIYGIQMALSALVVTYIYLLRRKINRDIYMAAFLILSSPVVLVGLTNSIRQSLAFMLVMLAFELRKTLWMYGLFIFALLMHSVSFLLIPLIFLMLFIKNFWVMHLKWSQLNWLFVYAFVVLLTSTWYLNQIVDFFYLVYDRYSIYIYSAEVFTEGRIGSTKLLVWIVFWFITLLLTTIANSGRLSTIYLIVPLLFTLLVTIDAHLRGFDEFHSRLLMLNNVFVLFWLAESVKSNKNKNFCYFVIFLLNVFNPTTIGVLV